MGTAQQPHSRRKPKNPGTYKAGKGKKKSGSRSSRYTPDGSQEPGGGASRSRDLMQQAGDPGKTNQDIEMTIEDNTDFSVGGADFRLYDGALWADGYELDDTIIRQIYDDKNAPLRSDASIKITITEEDIHKAREHNIETMPRNELELEEQKKAGMMW